MKTDNEETKRNEARHVCADCLETDTKQDRYLVFSIGPTPAITRGKCDVCQNENQKPIVHVKARV